MDYEKIGKFIATLRKENKLTQEELSKKLFTSRENISRWENGKNMPTTETLVHLGEIFNVSVNELIAGERRNNSNEEKIDNISITILNESNKKIKKILKYFIFIIIFLIMLFLGYYFLNTYKTIYVYIVACENEKFSSLNGIAIFSKNKSYLKIGGIESKLDYEYEKYELFYYDGDSEYLLFSSDGGDINLNNYYNNDELFSYKNMQKIIKNSYIRIIYDNGQEDLLKLNFQEDMSNNKLFFNNGITATTNKNFENNNLESENVNKMINYFQKNFKYNENDEIYIYETFNKDIKVNIQYSDNTNYLVITEYRNELQHIMEFNLITKDFKFTILKNDGTLVNEFIYNFFNQECSSDSCDNDQINYFLENYYNIYVN